MQRKMFIKRFIRSFLSFLIPVFIVMVIILGMWVRQLEGTLENRGRQTLSAMTTNLELSLSNVASQNSQFSNNPYTLLSLKRILSRDGEFSYSDALNMRGIHAALRSIVETYSYVVEVYLYLDGYDNFYTSEQRVRPLEAEAGEWWSRYREMDSDTKIMMDLSREENYGRERSYLIVCQRMVLHSGVVVMKIDIDAYRRVLDTALGKEAGAVALLNKEGSVIFTWNGPEEDLKALNGDMLASAGEKGAWLVAGSDRYLVQCSEEEEFGVRVVSLISQERRIRSLVTILPYALVIFVAGILVVLLVSYATTRKSYRYLEQMIQVFSDAEKGVYPVAGDRRTNSDEYSLLMNNIIYLFLKNVKLNADLKEKEHERETAQISALQAQINPHFLFNTLQTIRLEAMKIQRIPEMADNLQIAPNTDIAKLTEDLADILKYALSDPMQAIPLSEELIYLKKYVSIQKARFGDRFILYYEIDEGMENFPVFRLMLQPLIENSILHGVRYRQERGYIKLKVLRRGERAVFRVIDNGIGMSEEARLRLEESIRAYNVHNVGLANVNCRLLLYFGEEAGLKIRSREGSGTVVEFSLPITWTGH